MTIRDTITFSLTFSGLSSPLTVSHLHFAPTKVAGGVMTFLQAGGEPADLPGGHFRNHYGDNHGSKCYRARRAKALHHAI